jgi:protein-tyrosine phosphatase
MFARFRSVIDLHCHLLPSIDDGAKDLETSLAMAHVAVANGIRITACTPHILPGVYPNTGPAIRSAILELQGELDRAGIPLLLVPGADVHAYPDLVAGLKTGQILSIGKSRYFLLEPPQDVLPPRFDSFIQELTDAGHVPIITHPERMSWLDSHYDFLCRAVELGAWNQITAGSLVGKFGRRAKQWALRMLADGIVHLVASDAHDPYVRPPRLSEAFDILEAELGHDVATDFMVTRPAGVLRDQSPCDLPQPTRGKTERRSIAYKPAATEATSRRGGTL